MSSLVGFRLANRKHLGKLRVIQGFVRRLQEMEHSIPTEIVHLCAAFYLGQEYFACHGDSYQLDDDRTTITKMQANFESAFGHISIPSMSNKIHCWTFKVNHCCDYMCFGISDFGDYDVQRNCFLNDSTDKSHNYCAQHPEGKRSGGKEMYSETYDGFDLNDGSIIEMVLDLKRRELTFSVNGSCLGAVCSVACDEKISYKMAIWFHQQSSSVTLTNYIEGSHRKSCDYEETKLEF